MLWILSLACCLLMLLSSGRSVKRLLIDFTLVSRTYRPSATSVVLSSSHLTLTTSPWSAAMPGENIGPW